MYAMPVNTVQIYRSDQYATLHVTPQKEISYASFETNSLQAGEFRDS